MVLYHAISSYQLLSFIAHRMTINKDKTAFLLLGKTIILKYPYYKELLKIFNQVILIETHLTLRKGQSFKNGTSIYFNQVFQENGLNINDFEEIYVGAAHYIFGIYLTEHQIPFNYFEDACGMASRGNILYNMDTVTPVKSKKCLENGLYDGSNPCIQHILCDFDNQLPNYKIDPNKHVDFKIGKMLAACSPEAMKFILHFFHIKKYPYQADVILLTQHFANLKILTFEEQVMIYQMLMDFYFNDRKVIFKAHPDDPLYYKKLFPEAEVIDDIFPSELLPFAFEKLPQTVATVSSTAIWTIKSLFESALEFDTDFEKIFLRLNRYYIALEMLLRDGENTHLKLVGCHQKLVENLFAFGLLKEKETTISFVEQISEINDGDLVLVDVCQQEYPEIRSLLEMEQVEIIFLNSESDFCFYQYPDKSVWAHIIPIQIEKEKTREEDNYFLEEPERIYYYSKRRQSWERIRNMEIKKDLPAMGMKLKVSEDNDLEMQIKVLEGILKATENRLLYYMKRVDELEKNIDC